MSVSPTPKNSVSNTLKIYVFPALVTILATLIWRDVTEMRNDVKSLLAQSNVDKTEIQNLKKDVQMLDHQVFKTPMPVAMTDVNAMENLILYRDKYFKHEDIFDIKKYIPKS
jgi:hypothetical protein